MAIDMSMAMSMAIDMSSLNLYSAFCQYLCTLRVCQFLSSPHWDPAISVNIYINYCM